MTGWKNLGQKSEVVKVLIRNRSADMPSVCDVESIDTQNYQTSTRSHLLEYWARAVEDLGVSLAGWTYQRGSCRHRMPHCVHGSTPQNLSPRLIWPRTMTPLKIMRVLTMILKRLRQFNNTSQKGILRSLTVWRIFSSLLEDNQCHPNWGASRR